MKEHLLKAYDLLCTFIWKIFLFLISACSVICIFICKVLYAIWFLISLLWPFNKIAPAINNFSRKLNSSLKPLFRKIFDLCRKFLDKSDRSVKSKRLLSPILILVCFLTFHPPSHWGPWKLKEQGIASYYGYGFYFRKTASGERYYPWDVTAASLTLPLGTVAKVVNRSNGSAVYVRINDRGPYVKGRIIDLSFLAALKLGIYNQGIAPVEIYTRE
ncbi:MAG TPA: hypothetical protein DD381_05080 [Lentisphaeria bacterium]|nr:MAG: hypothetical protein A2X47_06335 [Lentisphaerae bacterium GWF2_38_69]HBM15704.1 hypothetical protein [Lentisphaeria bacterium]